MSAILTIIAPVFLMIAIGYISMRRHFFTQEQLNGLAKFVVKIGMPMLVFYAIATRPIAEVFKPTYFYGYSAASLVLFFIGWKISKMRGLTSAHSALNGLAAGMSNSGFIGYPLLLMAIGSPAAVYFAMNVLTESLLIFPLLFVLLDLSRGKPESVGAMLLKIGKSLATNPIIIALPASLVFAFGWLPLPVFMEKLSGMLSGATTPLALFMIGGNLYGMSICGKISDMVWVTAGKLLLCPLLIFSGLVLFGADEEMLFAGLLFAATPMASLYPLFGSMYGCGRETSGAMLLATVLSVIPISLVLFLGHHAV